MKGLYILKGLPGSGKSTIAESLSEDGKYPVFAADDFFMVDNKYMFDADMLGSAHTSCMNNTRMSMIRGESKIFVNNTFTKARDLKPYKALAEEFGYQLFVFVVEKYHDNESVHGVSEETMKKMENSLRQNLKFR